MKKIIELTHTHEQIYTVLNWFARFAEPSALQLKIRTMENGMEHRKKKILKSKAHNTSAKPSNYYRQLALYLYLVDELDDVFKKTFSDLDKENYKEEEIFELNKNLNLLGIPGFF